MADAAALRRRLGDGVVHLEPLGEEHREALRPACAADPTLWTIYARSWLGEHFDASFDAKLADARSCHFAAFAGGVLIGMSGYIGIDAANDALEIGSTYYVPEARGTGVNRRFKQLLLDRAFACGFHRVEFRVDTRNERSQAAMAKLGAHRDGVLRGHLITWTGHVRDSVIFSILKDEWPRG